MKKIAAMSMLATLAGCFTFNETPYPETALTSLAEGKELAIQLQGFMAVVTEYVPVYGYDTYWVDGGPRGPYGWSHGYYRTATSTTYVPQQRESDVFAQRAATLAESAGFTTKAAKPDYIVAVNFGGPTVTDGERGMEALWAICTLLTADYSVQTWTAQLKIYDNATGKLVFHHEYAQRYEVTVWGPLPLLSPVGASKNTFSAMQSWCLTALTDRVMADAAAFLSPKAK